MSNKNSTTHKILFLCPHAAAKSVLARTYFEHLAAKANIAATVWNAGTDPDADIDPLVKSYLEENGYKLSAGQPALMTDADLDQADIVVSIGCIKAERVPNNTLFLDWSDVPPLSNGRELSQQSIDATHQHVGQLVQQLQR